MENKLNKICKTLVITTTAPPIIGGVPKEIHNLFVDFPRDSYAVLASFLRLDETSVKIGTWLPGDYFFYDNPVLSGPGYDIHQKIVNDTQLYFGTHKRVKLAVFLFRKFKTLVRKIPVLRRVSRPLTTIAQTFLIVWGGKDVIRSHKFKVLLGISDSGPALIATFLLSKLTGRTYYLFLFDIYKGNNFPLFDKLLSFFYEPILIRNAAKIIVTNARTKEVYRDRYGKNLSCFVIHNSAYPPQVTKTSPGITREGYSIAFVGVIDWTKLLTLIQLIDAVEEINDIKICIRVYTPTPRLEIQKLGLPESNKVTFETLPPGSIFSALAMADILFLSLSWHTKSQIIIDTATSGKMAEYLIAGKPILVYAPRTTYTVSYAMENNFALVVDEENKERLKKAIRILLEDKALSQCLVKNAQRTFFRDQDARKNSLLLRDLLTCV